MQIEQLFQINFKYPPNTTDTRILGVLMVYEQQCAYIFLLTEWKHAGKTIRSLWQYMPSEHKIDLLHEGVQEIAMKWLKQFGRVFEKVRYDHIDIHVVESRYKEEPTVCRLMCEERRIEADAAAIFYMGQDIFGITCHSNPESSFEGLHYNDDFRLELECSEMNAGMLGICIDHMVEDGVHYMAYCSEAAYRLKRASMNYLMITDLKQPAQLMEFIIKAADPDIPVEIQDYEKQKIGKRFLGVCRIQNIVLKEEEELYIGDVTVTREVSLPGKVPKEFQLPKNRGAYMWVKVTAETLHEAYQKSKEMLDCAVGILNLLVKNDSFLPFYEKDKEMLGWRYAFHENIVFVEPGMYLENCDTAESIYFGGNRIEKNVIRIEPSIQQYLENENELDAMFNLFTDGEKHHAFLLMLRWFEAGCATDDLDEKIIYLDMALEFAMNGESGISFLESKGVDACAQKDLLNRITESIKEAQLGEELQEGIEKQIENTLVKNTNFLSKLQRFIETEELSMSDGEIELIKKMRKKRNAIAHGKRNVKFSKREAEKVTGIISNVLLAKVHKVVRMSERN